MPSAALTRSGETPHVLFVDPGLTTGWVTLDPTGSDPAATLRVGELPHFEFLDAAVDQIAAGHFALVACEAFQVGERTERQATGGGQRLWSVEQQGVLRWACQRWQVEYLLPEQQAAEVKRFATNEKLKAGGFWTRGQEHGRDATRHALLWLTRRGLIDPRRLGG